MSIIKIALVVLAISFAAFVSLVGYQSLSSNHYNHDLNYDDNTSSVSLAKTNYQGQTRTYYIAADEVKWDFAPTGINQMTGKPFGIMKALFQLWQDPEPFGQRRPRHQGPRLSQSSSRSLDYRLCLSQGRLKTNT